MRTILIGAVGSTAIVLRAMQEAGCPPLLLATMNRELGQRRHSDYVDLAAMVTPETETAFIASSGDPTFIKRVHDLRPDIIFVIGWSQVVCRDLRSAARRHCVGFHPTLLPALRGRAAIGWTILLGMEETGATLFEIGDSIDDGDILAQVKIAVSDRENVGSLASKLSKALEQMIRDLLPRFAAGELVPRPQPQQGVSYCARRTADDNLVNWRADRLDIDRLIRASSAPYSGAFTFTRKRRVTIWAAEPWSLPVPHHAAAGQIVSYVDGDPIVRCGDGEFLRITEYEAQGDRLSGQIRLRNRLTDKE